MAAKPNLPKDQERLSQDTISTYKNPESGRQIAPKSGLNTDKNRENQIRRDNDEIKNFKVGIKDIDEAIYYYFNEVLRPQVKQNGKIINVPLVYGSPERWSAVQKDGFYRDKNGKMQAPIILFRRDTLEKNRNLGNKLDANYPHNFGIFSKTFSKQNVYDRFALVNNRIPEEEYYAVTIPDYVNITYSCIIFTDYLEQNNKLIEGINFASDSYWGDPNKFRFRAMIDTYSTVTEVVQGNERINKTEFTINLLGHIITDTINAQAYNSKKFYSKSAVKFGAETERSL
tara:strand:+ start:2626 stop:3483 length:858 start_codon:yes stop_codon:yes gene_type:complete